MPYRKKVTKSKINRFVLLGLIVLTALALIAAGMFIFFSYQNDKEAKAAAALEAMPRIVIPEGHFAPMTYEKPEISKSIKALTLRPGIDLYKKEDADQATIEKEIDVLLNDLKALEFNSIILDTGREDSVVFASTKLQSTPIDVVSILLQKAAEAGVHVSLKLDLTGINSADGTPIESLLSPKAKRTLSAAATELAMKYEFENLQLDSYYTKKDGSAYAEYVASGMTEDYDKWLLNSTNAAFDEIVKSVKAAKSSLPVGLCIDNVWANINPDDPKTTEGSSTKAEFEALLDGHVDTKGLIQSGNIDFINAIIPTSTRNENESFETIAKYWGNISKNVNLPMFVTHSGENAANKELVGWNGTDELSRQVAVAVKSGNYYGSTFTGVDKLKENPGGSTEYLMKYFRDEIKEDEMFSDLEITSPTKTNFVTYDEQTQFRIKFDPNAEVLLNGEKVVASSRGGASVWVPLNVGKNSVTLEHKGQVRTYNIERKVIIFESVSPTKEMKVGGGSTITVGAMAYKGSTITATFNGKTITLVEDSSIETDTESPYIYYSGAFTAPKATNKEQPIGAISFSGTYQGYPGSAKGANIIVDKLPDDTEPDALTGQVISQAVVSGNYAAVYNYMSPTEFPDALLYPLPNGTQDIVVSQSGDYVNLRSGKTVHKSDVSVSDMVFDGNNAITQMSVGVEGSDTVIRMAMNWKSPFSITPSPYSSKAITDKSSYVFGANTVTLNMDYVTMVAPEGFSGSMAGSQIFSDISYQKVYNEARKINQMQITMPMNQSGRYYGCHSEWEGNTLVLRFNNGGSGGSLSGVRIIVDPGHGGSDVGNMAGRDVIEKVANLDQANRVANALRSLGAEVIMTRETDATMSLVQRVVFTMQNKADLFISVHYNSAANNPKPGGVQVYYNTPFSQPLAKSVQSQLDMVLPSTGWNGERGKNFFVTRSSSYPSILVECGFLSNPTDEARTFDPAYLDSFAAALAQGVANYYSAYN